MSDPSLPVLRVTTLSMRRDQTVLLNDVSWEVRAGEHWAVLGPNGCGKTSLLGALMSYAEPTSGSEIEMLGERWGSCDWRELRKRVGIVSSAVHSHLWNSEPALETVASGKFAAFGPWSKPDAADLAQAARLLEAVHAAEVAQRPWQVLSQGERQRVLMARALMADPDLLLLDEPCSNLDPVARERLLEVVQRFAAERRPTMVLVTHHIEEIVAAISHVLVLRRGNVVASGPKEKVLTSEVLSRAFDHPVTVRRRGVRFELEVATTAQGD
jgi:iron complex transport system ATP-binding protein